MFMWFVIYSYVFIAEFMDILNEGLCIALRILPFLPFCNIISHQCFL